MPFSGKENNNNYEKVEVKNMITTLISLAVTVLTIVSQWKVFEKTGEKGWKSIIPIYNIFTMFKIAKNDGFMKQVGAICAMSVTLTIGVMGIVGSIAASKGMMMVCGVIAILLAIACAIYLFVVTFRMYADFAEAFGHSRTWGILLIIPYVSTVAMCILAFGNDTYSSDKETPVYKKVVLKTILWSVLSVILSIAIVAGISIACNVQDSDLTDTNSIDDISSVDEPDVLADLYNGNNVLADLENSEDGKQSLENIADAFYESTFDGNYDSTYDYDVVDNEMTITVSMPDDTYQFLIEDINDCLDESDMLPFYLSGIGVDIKDSQTVKIIFSVKQGDTEIYNRTYDAGTDTITVNGAYYSTYDSIFEYDVEDTE